MMVLIMVLLVTIDVNCIQRIIRPIVIVSCLQCYSSFIWHHVCSVAL